MNSLQLAKIRTKLANQRTYLAYIRTGLVIAGVAGIFKKKRLVFFGLFMVVTSSYQYFKYNSYLKENLYLESDLLDNLPLIYIFLSIFIFYLQFYYK